MTRPPVPTPGPGDLPSIALNGLAHRLARAYLDRNAEQVASADDAIAAVVFHRPDPAGGADAVRDDMMRDLMAVQGAELMLEEWCTTHGAAPLSDVLATAGRLVDHAPAGLRDGLRAAVDQITADPQQLYAAALGHAGLPGHAGAHLYAALTAAAIDLMHPMLHNHARVVLEQQIRIGDTMGQGMPAAEAVTYAAEEEAAALLTELLPWTAEMTGDAHEITKRDLRALIQLYLLDHPVPTDEQKAELKALLDSRIEELTSTLGQRPARRAAPPPRLSAEQLAARRRAERGRRQAKKRRP
jgi:hypothetical protein